MRENVGVRAGRCLVGLVFVVGVVCGGCDGGGSDKTEMVKPEVPPEISAKASMDAYKAQMKGGSTPKKK